MLLVRGLTRRAEGLLVGLAIGCCIAAYTLVDKEGLRHASPLPVPRAGDDAERSDRVRLARRCAAEPQCCARRRAGRRSAPALGSFGAYALVLAALRLAPAPAVAAVRETSVVIAALLAAAFLHERVTPHRLAGAAAVAGGVALVALS